MLTLSKEVTLCQASGRVPVRKGWSGFFKVNAWVWSVGLHAKNFGILLTVTSLT